MRRRVKKRSSSSRRKHTPPIGYEAEECGRSEIAANIKHRVGKYYKDKMRMICYELGLTGWGRLRADVVALAMNGYVVIVEVKSCVADFKGDAKMHQYLEFCNQAYVALPESVYRKVKSLINPEFGVFVMTADGKYITKVVRSKVREIDLYTSYSIAIRAAFRTSEFSTRKNKAEV